MSNGQSDPERHEEEVDPGEPIAQLAGFEYDVSTGLLGRIRRAISRRTTAAQVTSFTFDLPFVVFKEFWTMLAEHLNLK
ncbi:hypothetical protein [Silvibacterium dinghuense]|uniref:Uncharacterized protein n=1 Tax=Silvibacterium dinghuense TaxID=1560006 RepID=A0A4Q1SDN7_9BACT|nr:hypothetical protein [Silvibacterium dinghuense]RXS95185.1 hypothetical protein ESZ00_11295 [Silvibacterium dinghuense]GGH11378.1 hypothetical protein GCM10011586_30020 [Silvibacterium dinghuense]